MRRLERNDRLHLYQHSEKTQRDCFYICVHQVNIFFLFLILLSRKNFHNTDQQSWLKTERLNRWFGTGWPNRRHSQTVLLIFIFCPPLRCMSAPPNNNNALTRCQNHFIWALHMKYETTYHNRLSQWTSFTQRSTCRSLGKGFIRCLASCTWWGKPMHIRDILGDPSWEVVLYRPARQTTESLHGQIWLHLN